MSASRVRTCAMPRSGIRYTLLWPLALLLSLVVTPPSVVLGQNTGTVTGQVINSSTGLPLGNIEIAFAGPNLRGVTEANGRYRVADVPAGTHTIRVSSIGFTRQERQIRVSAGETTVVNIELSSAVIDLEEILVTGTPGATRRRELGNSISSVRMENITTEPMVATDDILKGTVSSLQMTSNEGAPGAAASIRVRGVKSLTQGNRPLIYIDGVRMENEQLPNTVSQASRSSLSDINPADIERVEVIKGASATTLYGTEAAAGVIQIFTKRGLGQGERALWQVTISPGVLHQGRIGPEPPASWFEKYPCGPDDDPGLCGKSLFMDKWLKPGWQQQYGLSVRGRTERVGGVSYFVSGSLIDNDGVLPQQRNKQYTLRGNLGFDPTDWLSVQFNNSLTQSYTRWLRLGNLAESFSLNVFRGPFDYVTNRDSVFITQYDVDEWGSHVISGLEFRASPTPDLSVKMAAGLDYVDSDYGNTAQFAALYDPTGVRTERRWKSETRTLDFAANFTRTLAGIATTTSAGFQAFQSKRLTVQGVSRNFAGPGRPTLNTGSTQTASENRLEVINAGFFVQEMLGFGGKFFVTGGLRLDGNSAFGSDFGVQRYPKVSASYVISEEGFWPDFFDMTKLRVAYGQSGKAPGYFDAVKTWEPVAALEARPGVTPTNLGNPKLGPERTREIEAGVEFAVLNGRLSVDFSAFTQRTSDALVAVPQDPTSGYTTPQITNVGIIDNRGVEVEVNGTVLRGHRLTWELGMTASLQENEAVELGAVSSIFLGGSLTPGMYAREGYSLPSYFGPVPQNPNERAAPILQEEYLGGMYPTKIFSGNTNLRIGEHLSVSGRAEYQGGHVQLSHTVYRNVQRSVWPNCFDVAQKVAAGQTSELTAQERWRCSPTEVSWAAHVWPLDFVRLRSVGVSYRMPENLLGGFLGRLTLSAGGRNLWTWSRYEGPDPESSEDGDVLTRHDYYNMPIPKAFTFSITTQF